MNNQPGTFKAATLAAAAATCFGGTGTLAIAADTPTLEEIVVTAQKREQNLQEVPVSVTAFSAFELESKGLGTVLDLEKSSPNTQLRASRATNSTLTAYIRGVGQQDPLWGFEPGVGVYVDDVYYARPQAAAMDVIDVERIEILRGPQGTLYGKNTVGGAIKYVTKKLSGEATANVKLSIGTYDQRDLLVSAQAPLIKDKLFIGGTIAKLDRDGFGDVQTGFDINTGTFSGTVENYNKDVIVGRVNIEYSPTEDWFFRLAADKTDDESNQRCGSQSNQTAVVNPATGMVFEQYSDPYDSACGTTHISNVENQGFSFTANYDITEALSVKYIFADREGETQQFIDFEATPIDSFDVPASYTDEQQTHELQANFSTDRFSLVGGIYYYEGNAAGAFDVVLNGGSPFDGEHADLSIGGDVETESLSGYFNASYDLTDTLTLTAGLRVTEDDKAANIRFFSLTTGNSFPYTTNQGSGFVLGDPADDDPQGAGITVFTDIGPDEANGSWTEASPSVKLDWKYTDGIMVFLGYSEGFKSGGFDMRGNAATTPTVADGYDPETVESWELGIKSQLLDNRLRLNFTIFDLDYEDMQLTVQAAAPPPIFFSSQVINAGTATIQGAELEATAQISAGLSASLSVGYLDAELDEVISGGVDVSDTWEILNAPEWTGQFALSYEQSLDDYGSIGLNTAVSYRDASRNFNNVTCTCDQDESYTLWDLSANWYSNDEHWTVGLHLKNLTDEEYKTGGYNLGSGELAFYGDPRTGTLSVGYQF